MVWFLKVEGKCVLLHFIGPFNFAKLHGCGPASCKCKDGTILTDSISTDIYLAPMEKVAEEVARKRHLLVRIRT